MLYVFQPYFYLLTVWRTFSLPNVEEPYMKFTMSEIAVPG
jgi:hypothetical protein